MSPGRTLSSFFTPLLLLLRKTIFRGPMTISFCIVILGCIAFISGVSFLDVIELKTIDLRFKMRGEIPPGDTVVLAAIDEKSLQKEGQWVWERSKIARLISKLSEKGARVIALDVGFFEPESSQIVGIIDKINATAHQMAISSPAFEQFLDNLKIGKNNDRILARTIRDAEAKVVLGYFFQVSQEEAMHISPEDVKRHKHNIEAARYDIVRYDSEAAKEAWLIGAAAPQSNIPLVSESSPLAGYFNKLTDPDGVVRRLPMTIRFEDNLYAPLSIKAVGAYLGESLSIKIAEEYGVESLYVGERYIPTTERGEMFVNFRGTKKTFSHLSVTDILHDAVPAEAVRDKIVVIGATAIGIHDECVTPFDKVFPGPEVHLNVIDSVLAGDYLYHPAWAALFDLLVIICGGLFFSLVLSRTGPLIAGIAGVLIFGGYIWLCHYFFSEMGWILNMVYPFCVFLLVYLAVTSYKYFVEEGQKKFIRSAFSKYLAPEVVNQLIESPNKLVLGGERREITAFFSDVQGFTNISEKLAPEELVELLNEFLTEITDVILHHKGGVDKFEGDAAIAFFGAPNELENHAEAACWSCIDIQQKMINMREKWRQQGKPALYVRIGLHSGPAVVGNMGSRNRMDYTMMGDTVNTAARLEGVNKRYGTYTLIGETTYQAAGKSIVARELDAVKVVGKALPIAIYELLGYAGKVESSLLETAEHYARGLEAYRNQHWEKAIEFFTAALEVTPEDGPSQVMIRRCKEFRENPPGADWDGSFSLTTK